MKEKDLYPIVQQWLRITMRGKCGAVEVKICKGKSLPYSEIYEHQWNNLDIVGDGDKVFTYKISDDSRGQKPFDIFYLGKADAFFCICFYNRGSKRFYMIHKDTLFATRHDSSRKSITEEECRGIASHSFKIGGE